MTAVRVCELGDVGPGQAKRFTLDGHEVALVNLGGEGMHALEAVCSHEHAWLDEGEVDLDMGTIECPKHGSTFDVATGRPRSLPAIKPVATYPVTVDGEDIYIEVANT